MRNPFLLEPSPHGVSLSGEEHVMGTSKESKEQSWRFLSVSTAQDQQPLKSSPGHQAMAGAKGAMIKHPS